MKKLNAIRMPYTALYHALKMDISILECVCTMANTALRGKCVGHTSHQLSKSANEFSRNAPTTVWQY